MIYNLNGNEYVVEIIKKRNRHTYIRVKDDLTIYVTTNHLVTNKSIEKLLDENKDYLEKMISKKIKEKKKEEELYILGKRYNLIISNVKKIEISGNNLYVSSEKYLDNWIKKETKKIFLKRLEYIHSLFEERIPYPKLRIRNMKTRWGVCNRKLEVVTLNSKLIREDIEKID